MILLHYQLERESVGIFAYLHEFEGNPV